jgi:hypothetical protein
MGERWCGWHFEKQCEKPSQPHLSPILGGEVAAKRRVRGLLSFLFGSLLRYFRLAILLVTL